MLSRQSTMLKPIGVFAIFLAFIALAHGQGNSGVAENTGKTPESTTAVGTTDVDNQNNSLLGGHLLVRFLTFLQGTPLGIIFIPLGIVLKPMFTALDAILAPVYSVLRVIFSPILFVANIVLLPVHGVTGLVSAITTFVGGLLANVGSAPSSIISIITGFLSYVLAAVSDHTVVEPRNKRAAMDSLTGMAWSALSLPFRYVYGVFTTFFSTLRFFFNIVTWPLYYYYNSMTGSQHSSELALSSDLSSISTMVPSFLLNLTDYTQDSIVEMLMSAWGSFKEYALPALDEILVWASKSSFVPTEVQTMLNSLHAGYSMLHMLGIV